MSLFDPKPDILYATVVLLLTCYIYNAIYSNGTCIVRCLINIRWCCLITATFQILINCTCVDAYLHPCRCISANWIFVLLVHVDISGVVFIVEPLADSVIVVMGFDS
jgi:hypothetical protein